MSYVYEHLLPGEEVVHTARLHKITYALPILTSLLFLAGAVYVFLSQFPVIAGAVLLIVALLPLVYAWVSYTSSEFAVTNKRVIIKVGWIQRRTLETILGKVEGIGVDQGIIGRILNYGTITVTGTDGTMERFANIAAPLEFRRQVQSQVSAAEGARAVAATAAPAGPPREERECPYCAERILVRARVCKHCGRDVEPLTT